MDGIARGASRTGTIWRRDTMTNPSRSRARGRKGRMRMAKRKRRRGFICWQYAAYEGWSPEPCATLAEAKAIRINPRDMITGSEINVDAKKRKRKTKKT